MENVSSGGIAFFLASENSLAIPSNSGAGWLGLFNETNNGDLSNQIVAVEFDTLQDQWDPSNNHVGIDVNSIVSMANLTWNNTMVSGDILGARVSYNATSKNLHVFLKDPDAPNDFGSLNLTLNVELRDFLPEKVIVGFSASTGRAFPIQAIRLWNFTSTLDPVVGGGNSKKWVVWLIIGIVALVVGTVLIWAVLWRIERNKKLKEEDYEDEEMGMENSIDEDLVKETGPKRFTYKELVVATNNFSEEGKLGQGGFGSVYRGFLADLNMEIAVKKISSSSKQGKKEYISEVKIISHLRHRNLVQLVGWSHERGSFVLVYEYMPNGSLESHLFGKKTPLTWPLRHRIAHGLASGLLYVHEEWEQCVVHRDIKSSNVMLDSNFNAKLGDFGLARLVDHGLSSATTVSAGTMGYMAPECVIMTSKASKESDVFSFGVVALEIACGRKAVEPRAEESKVSLVSWVWDLYGRGRLLEAADETLNGEFDKEEMICLMTVGLWCAHPDHNLRPTIRQAIQVLNFEVPLPSLPSQMPVPMYFAPAATLSSQLEYTWTSGTVESDVESMLDGEGNVVNLSFNFTSFNPNMHDITYLGDASPSGQVIQLTRNRKNEGLDQSSGRATYYKQMQLWDKASGNLTDFTTHFSFIIDSQHSNATADGIAFFLAPYGFPLPDPQEGRGLGLVSRDQILNSTLYPFVAVEFDTYPNLPTDPPYNHVGIDISSMKSNKTMPWSNRILSGERNNASISYNSSTKVLKVVFTDFPGNTTVLKHLYFQVDLRKVLPEWVIFGISAATGNEAFEIHTLLSWYFSSSLQIENVTSPTDLRPPTPNPEQNRTNKRKVVLVLVLGLVLGACVLISGLGWLYWYFSSRKRRTRVEKKDDYVLSEFENETGPKKFSYKELSIATKNFVEEEKLGEGGFGGVYRGFLKELNFDVAVKRVSRGSKQGIKEYASEVKIISRLRHRNLVQLIGWCHEERELLLVYDFMPNGSLDSHLFKENSLLTWVMRYNIARGLASALFYLHEEWEQCVLHRDIKSSNVMLDSNFNAKLGDFGLARLVDHGKGSQTTVLAGTMGYMATECLMTGKASKESDVYSYGVVALEIACGRKPINPLAKEGQIRLVDWVWDLYGMGKLLKAADAKLRGDFDEEQMECLMMVGLWCVHPDCNLRPSIKQAIQVLNFEVPLPSIPLKMPMYSATPLNMSASSLSSSYGVTSSEGGQTQSLSSSYKIATSSAASSSSPASLLHT
ncbi:hypothetical protein F0562_020869 [Nyssa sinensis]|uniref:non-specific serine/threonine protein kinase n=1 Tax=Nyssa sinensis TaxID=561372 RepID=A0A5J5BUC6_9ASTE|nr:hypothetical protein F0562_020869 [Nyssa sinensis]